MNIEDTNRLIVDGDRLKEEILGRGLEGAYKYNCIQDTFDIIDELAVSETTRVDSILI